MSLQKHAQVLSYACHVARNEDLDEADAVELIVRVSALDRETIRRCSRVLGVLGPWRQIASKSWSLPTWPSGKESPADSSESLNMANHKADEERNRA